MLNFENAVYEALDANNDPESHRELDSVTFHPSQMAMCKRQMLLSKLGIKNPDSQTLGIFRIGRLMHYWLENNIPQRLPIEAKPEIDVSGELETSSHLPNIKVVGNADLYIPELDCVVDYKSQNGWYYFDPKQDRVENSKRRHLAQINVYMHLLDAKNGKLVYVDKGKFEPRQYPQDDNEFMSYDKKLIKETIGNAEVVLEYLEYEGFPQNKHQIPFEKCTCFVCESENTDDLEFGHLINYTE